MDGLTPGQSETVTQIVDQLHPRMRLFVVTGAGMSAESGLPTYRGVGGLYNSGETEEGMPIEKLLSGPVYRRQPELTWKYLGEIGKACSGKQFNRGHEILAEMERWFADVCVLTQNIDGFHLDAGSQKMIEIHGNLHHLRCERCGFRKTVCEYRDIEIPPRCNECPQIMRPDVVLFEEMLLQGALDQLQQQWEQGFDAVFSIGTTSVFPYIAEPVLFAARNGLLCVEINPSDTTVSPLCRYRLELPATIALEHIWQRLQERAVGS